MVILVVGSKAKAIDPRDLYICARPKMREARENENENENEIFIKKKHDGKKRCAIVLPHAYVPRTVSLRQPS